VTDLEHVRRIVRLQQEFAQLYAQLSILPHGSTQSYNGSGARSSEHPGGRRPSGEAHPEADRLLVAWTAARWDARAMERVLEQGREDLEAFKRSRAPEKTEDPRALRRDIQSKRGWTDREVAQAMRLTVREVHEARLAAKCCPAKGYPYVGCSVVELANRGNSVRQIEGMLKISKSVVDRTLRSAA
jgi:transposase